ncbi:alanyl-tRNA editing protein [Halovenus sp. WSH3]|uniref:Alanyl-tRNA editing protein n=1 Tax=Halovenus carboxidivorans TaxID=2692199 RepID=A0A6B0T2W4_9EURY|nr:alanyl-tRNA editing protein [Halovenus carboxidivorans]MXR52608.1 alanyl-tRNA editing protein [Halovenus carboxidivorans]
MTELRYLPDADDVTEFEATVTTATEEYIILDGTYFYPEGGGQPPDHGTIEWDGGSATIDDVWKDHGDVRHGVQSLDGDPPTEGTAVTCRIDEQRRRNLSRMHTAQHVVSRVVLDEFDASTAGNQVYAERSRIDFEPASFDDADLDRIEELSNTAIEADYGVTKEERPREQVEENVDEGRALLDMIPDHVDPLRVVAIEEFDMCPCGGTHADSLGELGGIEILDCTSKGENVERIEFTLDNLE